MATDERVVTAYHEAGHAVLAWMFGIHVASVTLEHVDHTLGRTVFHYPAEVRQLIQANDLDALRVLALIGLGGMAADAEHWRRTGRMDSVMTGHFGDQLKVRDHLFRAGYRNPADFEAFLMVATVVISQEEVWSAVTDLAEALIANTIISGERLAEFHSNVPDAPPWVYDNLEGALKAMRIKIAENGSSFN